MSFLGKASSVAAFAIFAWWMSRILTISIRIFYPSTHIPFLNPQPAIRDLATVHPLAWQEPFEYEAAMYITTMSTLTEDPQLFLSTAQRIWHIPPQPLTRRHPKFSDQVRVVLPDALRQQNGTELFAFLFVQRAGAVFPDFGDKMAAVARTTLVSVRPRKINRKHALLEGNESTVGKATEAEATEEAVWVPHGKTRVSWEIVLEDNWFYDWGFPLDLGPYLRVNRVQDSRSAPYIPLLWENPLSITAENWYPLTNQSHVSKDSPLDALDLQIDLALSGVVLGWFRLSNYVSQGLNELTSSRSLIQYTETDVDNLKQMVYGVNPMMLAITVSAMALHILFEFLAYKEDVSFWAGKTAAAEGLDGISRSSMLMSLASSWISFMYMWDRRKETNIVVLLGAAAGALVEAWKVTKVLSFRDLFTIGKRKPEVAEGPVSAEMENRKKVQREVDQQTAWYMIFVCLPAMSLYAAFSLLYQHHESFISWFLHISLATVYTLEFIQMWPQLLINHKLRTVDMLPLTAFLYRFLLTFIDDLYALVVPMPLIERIGTLRDDVVFFVLCYQWFKFPKRKTPAEVDMEKKKAE
ncbi:cleft lip and palate transmembrane protein 1-domain-containing protein [Kickxella alabastrina]|uniref:cleft lip and palate transmembrane protein 1-domain-containing protein n=1 Tax=Kickxella alabastrina TaxID=61397 RepID=UPI00221EE00E|nr:cleft lip and palate transmembrane protein 1-domain-containing protein [Kickxella alabastrina]KAI7834973.1 cleft lip and palate transmembrane protein 1-domain-containing protein [Kickxella alabastrina]KAJ1947864.1 Cleft lip and palate associated transmembrane protein 1 [Kickxella alabastrina]